MSITKSYNKYTDTYYAYDTTYVWDEKSQRKVQKKVCIGKFDPETGEVIPNGRRGRPSRQSKTKHASGIAKPADFPDTQTANETLSRELSAAIAEMNEFEMAIDKLEEQIQMLKEHMRSLRQSFSENE